MVTLVLDTPPPVSLIPLCPCVFCFTHTCVRAARLLLAEMNQTTLGQRNGKQVFDTCNVHNDRAYGLHFHLDRFLKGAATARIEHNYTKEALRDIILATIAAGGRSQKGTDALAKFWLSAGRQASRTLVFLF